MGLETATFVNNLVATNPVAGDTKSQGDDHLRLIKAALQATFPNASKAFYFPDSAAKTIAYSVVAADMNKLLTGDATAGAFAFTLPTLAAGDAGWQVEIMKIDASVNAITLTATINGAANPTLTRRYEGAIILWTGTAWFMMRQRPTIDTVDFSNNAITDAILRDAAGLSVIGRSANSTGDPADIVAASDGFVLFRNGATLGFGQLPTLSYADASVTLAKLASSAKAFEAQLYHVTAEFASGTDGGALSSGSWNTRELNTERTDELGLTLGTNQVPLTAGTYRCFGIATTNFTGTGIHGTTQAITSKLRIRNVTDGTTLLVGISERYSKNDDGGGSDQPADQSLLAYVSGTFVLAGTKNIELQNWVANGYSAAAQKAGRAISSGEAEVYTDLQFYKIA